MKVLISLYKGYGLGDAVQMSAVLHHVCKYRPDWKIDYQAEAGKEVVGNGIVCATFAYGEPQPSPHYDAEVQILLFDTFANWHNKPNTRVVSCLHERFGLDWDAELGNYIVNVDKKSMAAANALLSPILRKGRKLVGVHYQGDSAPDKKNLSHEQAHQVCKIIERLGMVPLLLDWRNESPLPDNEEIFSTGRFSFSRDWGKDARMNCAIIKHCEAFIGIDSGPGKCASATDVPTLIVWTGHHPAPFHDPCPNTTHLVPDDYNSLPPVRNDLGVVKWFEDHYKVIRYWKIYRDPVISIEGWLRGLLL